MDTKAKKISPIHYLVVAAFCLGGQFVPGFAGITPLGMGILGCFVGAVYGWITIDMLWPSIVAMFGLGMTSIGFDRVIAGSFGNTTVMALILCMGVNWCIQLVGQQAAWQQAYAGQAMGNHLGHSFHRIPAGR